MHEVKASSLYHPGTVHALYEEFLRLRQLSVVKPCDRSFEGFRIERGNHKWGLRLVYQVTRWGVKPFVQFHCGSYVHAQVCDPSDGSAIASLMKGVL